MIASITDGGNTAGLLQYLVGPGRANEHTRPHVVAGASYVTDRWGGWESLSPAQGFEIARGLDAFMEDYQVRPTGRVRTLDQETGRRVTVGDRRNHVWHCSLSLRPGEGPLSDETWQKIVTDFADALGFTGADGRAPCQWVAVRHGAAKNGGDHVHIVVNVVRADGTKWSPWQDQVKASKACNAIEHRYGLEVVEAREHARGARADTAADLRASQREGRPRTDRAVLEERIRAAAAASSSEADFVERLRGLGVRARPRFARGRTDVVEGYSVALRDSRQGQAQWYAGGKVARDLTLTRLRARWPDTPGGAQQAVDAWRRGCRDARSHRAAAGDAQWRARTAALEAWAAALAGTDPRDDTALADAAHDVAGLLAAAAVAHPPGPGRDALARAAAAAGRCAQTHRRPHRPAPTPPVVVRAAALLTATGPGPGATVVALSALHLAQALAGLHDAADQARTAHGLLRDAQDAFRRLHQGAPARHGAPNPWLTPGPGRVPGPWLTARSGDEGGQQGGGQAQQDGSGPMSPDQVGRIRRLTALARGTGPRAAAPGAGRVGPRATVGTGGAPVAGRRDREEKRRRGGRGPGGPAA